MVVDPTRLHDRFAGPPADDWMNPDVSTNRVLVGLDADDPDAGVREIRHEVEALAAEVHLLLIYPMAEYAERRRVRDDDGITGPFTPTQLAEEARRMAIQVGRDALGLEDGRFEAMGSVGDKRTCLHTVIRKADYQRVYVADQPRSIWDRLIGDEQFSTELARTLSNDVIVRSFDEVVETTGELDGDEGFDQSTKPTARPQDT